MNTPQRMSDERLAHWKTVLAETGLIAPIDEIVRGLIAERAVVERAELLAIDFIRDWLALELELPINPPQEPKE